MTHSQAVPETIPSRMAQDVTRSPLAAAMTMSWLQRTGPDDSYDGGSGQDVLDYSTATFSVTVDVGAGYGRRP